MILKRNNGQLDCANDRTLQKHLKEGALFASLLEIKYIFFFWGGGERGWGEGEGK